MGPRLINRGNSASFPDRHRRLGASMGPRLINRGNDRSEGHFHVLRDASMGPRLINRGNHYRLEATAITLELQWGRG